MDIRWLLKQYQTRRMDGCFRGKCFFEKQIDHYYLIRPLIPRGTAISGRTLVMASLSGLC